MIDLKSRFLVVADIDGTQLREDVPKEKYNEHDLADIFALKENLDRLSEVHGIIVHSTNRMAELVIPEVGGLLAMPDYITCSASTRILKVDRKTGKIEDDPDYNLLVESCEFSAERCHNQASAYPELAMTDLVNQTPRKVSYTFVSGTPLERRQEIFRSLQEVQPSKTKVFMVEDRDNHIIDFLPEFCTKQEVVKFILQKERIPAAQVIAFGNSNNDIPLFRDEFHCVAVGDARPSLVGHVLAQQGRNGSNSRHMIAPYPHTKGVIWGLQQLAI